jgi:hypothetical protein
MQHERKLRRVSSGKSKINGKTGVLDDPPKVEMLKEQEALYGTFAAGY